MNVMEHTDALINIKGFSEVCKSGPPSVREKGEGGGGKTGGKRKGKGTTRRGTPEFLKKKRHVFSRSTFLRLALCTLFRGKKKKEKKGKRVRENHTANPENLV